MNLWQVNKKIWQVKLIIWQDTAEIKYLICFAILNLWKVLGSFYLFKFIAQANILIRDITQIHFITCYCVFSVRAEYTGQKTTTWTNKAKVGVVAIWRDS